MVLTVSFVLSPVTGLVCHRHQRFRKLDASVGASGPHDFAVRVSAIRQRRRRVHRIPRPTSVTIAKRPSEGAGRAGYRFDLGETRSGIFLQTGLDSQIGDLPVGSRDVSPRACPNKSCDSPRIPYPVRRGLSGRIDICRNTGSPAFAGDDDGRCGAHAFFAICATASIAAI